MIRLVSKCSNLSAQKILHPSALSISSSSQATSVAYYSTTDGRQKRGLTKEQLGGGGGAGVRSAKVPPNADYAPGVASGPSLVVPGVVVLAASLAGGGYYYAQTNPKEAEQMLGQMKSGVSSVQTSVQDLVSSLTGSDTPASSKKKEADGFVKQEQVTNDTADAAAAAALPKKKKKKKKKAAVENVVDEKAAVEKAADTNVETAVETAKAAPAVAAAPAIAAAPASDSLSPEGLQLLTSAYTELQSSSAATNTQIRASIDSSTHLTDLDKLTPPQLRIRLISLVSELHERIKWEAVKLNEHQALVERQMTQQQAQELSKQRLLAETQTAQKLLELEQTLTSKANMALEAKNTEISKMIQEALNAQKEIFAKDAKVEMKQLEELISAKQRKDAADAMAELKLAHAEQLAARNQELEALKGRLVALEGYAQGGKDYQKGSVRAHKLSAAALALADRLESNAAAGNEMSKLRTVLDNTDIKDVQANQIPVIFEAVINLERMGVSKGGVPTLPELQTRFDTVRTIARRAAFIPKGMALPESIAGSSAPTTTLTAQILGYVFASLTFSPPMDETTSPTPATISSTYEPDVILARAKQYLENGQLEAVVQELDRLKYQEAFTVKDWKNDAVNRINVNKALKVLKMECALLNERMSTIAA